MSEENRKAAKGIAKAFKKMKTPMSKGGTGGSFTAAATKAGFEDSPAGRKAYAKKVLADKNATPKMKKKANFYSNIISKR